MIFSLRSRCLKALCNYSAATVTSPMRTTSTNSYKSCRTFWCIMTVEKDCKDFVLSDKPVVLKVTSSIYTVEIKIIEAPFGITPVETSGELLDNFVWMSILWETYKTHKFLQEISKVIWNIQRSSSRTQLGYLRHIRKVFRGSTEGSASLEIWGTTNSPSSSFIFFTKGV